MAAEPPTILHVDDYAGTRYAVRRILRRAGFRVVSAASGAEGLRRARQGPSLVILDVHLPDMSGLEVCRRLKSDARTAHLPVLHLSATCTGVEDRVRGLENGADAYLVEPVEPAELLAMVRLLLAYDDRLEALRQRVRELERLLAARPPTRLLSYLGHEMRTPLNAILTLTRLLLERSDGELTAEQERQVALIRQAAADLSRLVDDTLTLVRAAADTLPVRPERFRVGELFAALEGTFRPLHANAAVALVFEPAPALPPLVTDQHKLAQILRNLIDNALRHTARGEVRVAARYRPADDTVAFTVTDTGPGIAPEAQARIFEPFVQLEGAGEAAAGSAGLGLALGQELARLLGGDLTVQSRPGAGTTFALTLPRVYAARR
ncbi:MAG: hypothetical protein KatS3mg131_3887 [Candidatus Tectimicrobiota bacterium]|nr:MAG: hypothetical protein KatS3mg131_3887 [Candidatus Tectomicrobia bacterium]